MNALILEVLADEDKVNIVRACFPDEEKNKYKKIIIISILILIPIYIAIDIYYPEALFLYFYPLISLLFFVPLVISFLYGESFSKTLVDYKYYIVVKEANLYIRIVSLLQTESIFIYPIDDIGAIGSNEKRIEVKCKKQRITIEGSVIEIFNKKGRKIFEFGFWMHEDDVIMVQKELALAIKLEKARKKELSSEKEKYD